MAEEEKTVRDGDIDQCDFICVHENVVNQVLKAMPKEQQLMDLADFFKFLATQRESEFSMCSASPRCVSVILPICFPWGSRQFPISFVC